MTTADVSRQVLASRLDQGLPKRVDDATILANVALLLVRASSRHEEDDLNTDSDHKSVDPR